MVTYFPKKSNNLNRQVMFKQKAITALMLLFLSSMFLLTSCSKDDDDNNNNASTPLPEEINAVSSPQGLVFITDYNSLFGGLSFYNFGTSTCYYGSSNSNIRCNYQYAMTSNYTTKLGIQYTLSNTYYDVFYFLTFTDDYNGTFVQKTVYTESGRKYTDYTMGKFKFFKE